MRYWLMKTEPDVFSIDDLHDRKNQTEGWNGVRNYEARNIMRDQMQVGDAVIIYHSSCTPPGAAGIARVASRAYPDPDQFDAKSEYYDEKSTRENPRWYQVDVQYVGKFLHLVTLAEIRAEEKLEDMVMFKKNRLSVSPLTRAEFTLLEKMGNKGS